MMRRSPKCTRSEDLDIACRYKDVIFTDELSRTDTGNEWRTCKLNDSEEPLHECMTSRLLNLEAIQMKSNITRGDGNRREEAKSIFILGKGSIKDRIKGIFARRLAGSWSIWTKDDIFT